MTTAARPPPTGGFAVSRLQVLAAAFLAAVVTLGTAGCVKDRATSRSAELRRSLRPDRSESFLSRISRAKVEAVDVPVWEDRAVKDPASLKVAYGDWMVSTGQSDEARAAFAEAMTLDATNTAAIVGMARVEASEGNVRAAGELLDEAGRVSPNDAAVMAARGEFALTHGSLDDAATLLERAAELDPSDSDSRHRLGIVRVRQGRIEEARALFVGTVGPAGASYSIGKLLRQTRPQLAAAEFRRALELEPGMTPALQELAKLGGRPGSGMPQIIPASHDRR